LVNDVAEMLGAAAALEVVDELLAAAELEALLVVLDDELPQPAATADKARPKAHTRQTRVLILHAPLKTRNANELTYSFRPNLRRTEQQWQMVTLASSHINAP
jgi:hypothetical protein